MSTEDELEKIGEELGKLLKGLNSPDRPNLGDSRVAQATWDEMLNKNTVQDVIWLLSGLPTWLRQFKGQLPIVDFVEFLSKDLVDELKPIADLVDNAIDWRMNVAGTRVKRLRDDYQLSEETALRLVEAVTKDFIQGFVRKKESGE